MSSVLCMDVFMLADNSRRGALTVVVVEPKGGGSMSRGCACFIVCRLVEAIVYEAHHPIGKRVNSGSFLSLLIYRVLVRINGMDRTILRKLVPSWVSRIICSCCCFKMCGCG